MATLYSRRIRARHAVPLKKSLNSVAGRVKRRMLRLSLHDPSAFPSRGTGDLWHTSLQTWIHKEPPMDHPLGRAAEAVARGEAATIRS